MPSTKSGKPRPSEVAADTKRNFIPLVKERYADIFPPYSYLYRQPAHIQIQRKTTSIRPPQFIFEADDPVARAIAYGDAESIASEAAGSSARIRLPFICAANERRPGGDWETACAGYEEKLCRRSNLSATLAAPWPQTGAASNYPIPSDGIILSDHVVVCRGPHDRYEKLDNWFDLPVVSVPPTRWPKLKDNGTKYSFSQERDMIKDKIRGALRICLYNNYTRIVIGDFGLGNNHRNPPQEMAEMWRDVFLFDPEIRGQFHYVVFVFDDPCQSTMRLILEETAKQEAKNRAKSKHCSAAVVASKSMPRCPTDLDVFQAVFDPSSIDQLLSRPDPRYGLDMITT